MFWYNNCCIIDRLTPFSWLWLGVIASMHLVYTHARQPRSEFCREGTVPAEIGRLALS